MEAIDHSLRRHTLVLLAAAALAPLLGAQECFPSEAVRIIVPFAGGGVGDPIARLVAARSCPPTLGHQVIDENPTSKALLRSSTDRYSVLIPSSFTTAPHSLYSRSMRDRI